MVRVDSTSVESEALKLMMALEGAKLASICPTKSHYTCLRAEELKVSKSLIGLMGFEVFTTFKILIVLFFVMTVGALIGRYKCFLSIYGTFP
jgi:hypothetical protein